MLLDDLLDDREAEAGAAHPRRHIRLGQPLAVLGQADAGVENVDDQLVPVASCTRSSTRSPARLCSPRLRRDFNRFDRVLDDIGQRLAELAAVADHHELALERLDDEADPGMRDFVQEQRLAGDLVDILLAEHRLGHAREVGEFVDHAAQVADLADDRSGQPLERLLVGLDFLPEAALQPFGGELDRRQRVLDLVGDAPRDVRPGGAALVGSAGR